MKNLSVAYGMQKRSKKMAEGGLIEPIEKKDLSPQLNVPLNPRGMGQDPRAESEKQIHKQASDESFYEGIKGTGKGYAKGGLVSPHNIVKKIMMAKGGMCMADGGVVPQEDLSHEEFDELDLNDQMPQDPLHEIVGTGEIEQKMRRKAMLQGILNRM